MRLEVATFFCFTVRSFALGASFAFPATKDQPSGHCMLHIDITWQEADPWSNLQELLKAGGV